MKITMIIISILLALVSLSCEKKEQESQPQTQNDRPTQSIPIRHPPIDNPHTAAAAKMITGVVEEVLQATSYTYLKVKSGDRDLWIAVTKREARVGETVSFEPGLPMKNFESKDLQQTFETLYLVDTITGGGPSAPAAHDIPHRMKLILEKQDISVDPAEGGVTIAELFSDRESYADKTVAIKGKVTKVNRAIMNRNWVHIQDGTSYSGNFDLTITTREQVNVGDVVTFEGKIVLNQDFSAGYTYDVLMEDAKLKTE
jgi:hypothetical protein